MQQIAIILFRILTLISRSYGFHLAWGWFLAGPTGYLVSMRLALGGVGLYTLITTRPLWEIFDRKTEEVLAFSIAHLLSVWLFIGVFYILHLIFN